LEVLSDKCLSQSIVTQDRLVAKNNENNDNYGRAMLSQQLCFRWLQIRLN
jgi:hypothetical protein